ncbi:MAG: beta-propeller fold lactonase family protein, partial [Blautia coccoides]
FWVVSERSNEVYCFSVKGESFHLMETLPILETLPLPDMLPVLEREACAAAAVRLSDDERFLYISLRGADQIAVLKVDGEHMELVERVSSQGEHPRDFILSKDGQFLLTVNRNCGGLVSMKRDLDSGKIVKITGRAEISQGVSVILE